jgi:tetratricopeptide (TPR) repeat protein
MRLRARLLTAMGTALCGQGRYAPARQALVRALRLVEGHQNGNEDLVVPVLNALGMHGKLTARFAEAGRHYRRALRLTARDDDQTRAALYHNLGGLEHARGRPRRGIPFARRSVELRTRVFGARDPRTAADVAALAALLAEVGAYRQAELAYARALRIFRRAYGPRHYEVAVNYGNLGALYHATGKWARAERLHREALLIKQEVLGASHPGVAMTLNNLAVLQAQRGQTPEALRLYRRALAIFARSLGPRHPHTRTCQANAAALEATR